MRWRPPASCTGVGLLGTTVIDLSGVVPRDAGRWLLCLDVTADSVAADRGNRSTPLGRPGPADRGAGRRRWPASSRRTGCPGRSRRRTTAAAQHGAAGAARPAATRRAVDPRVTWRRTPQPGAAAHPARHRPGRQRGRAGHQGGGAGGHGPARAASSAPPVPARASCCAPSSPSLAITHSSEELNFVLVDFKGGATFASLDVLPHTSAVITNLADELPHGRPHAGRARRRDGAPPGAAAGGRQLRLPVRVREGAGRRRAAGAAAQPARSSATSSASCSPPSRTSSTCS